MSEEPAGILTASPGSKIIALVPGAVVAISVPGPKSRLLLAAVRPLGGIFGTTGTNAGLLRRFCRVRG